MFNGKQEKLIAENAALKKEVELLTKYLEERKEEILDLRKQLKYTQEALIAKESPEAYKIQKYEEEMANNQNSLTKEEIKQRKKLIETTKIAGDYINEIENPLFKDPDDMIQGLTRIVGVPLSEDYSLHGNDES